MGVKVQRFSENAIDNITLLYLQQQNLSDKSIEELCDLYADTREKVKSLSQVEKELPKVEPMKSPF